MEMIERNTLMEKDLTLGHIHTHYTHATIKEWAKLVI